ncbi:RNA methyltransferase [Leptothermofonsia sichuanensis E412]|uniref:RNA methyltransferase n=1 Tax=Leptothermofonsia sichuanensis TaxID=2917832 RepID=UPI001CA73051|nr:RNA methyltransferase [Leptothermofonsia sichuanensis]QZZ19363.1 RNA methyltransferase [Leptothermofonsia sichuanensis E412]
MVETPLANIRIVLVEPAGALNVGAIARVMKNMGLSQLVLVSPHCDHRGDEARQMAVHAGEVLEKALVVASLPEGLSGCQWAIATTARSRTLPITLEPPKTALPWLLEVAWQGKAALIFGPEDRGLNNTELNYAQRFLSIPSSPDYPSLNLAQAVAICGYELYQEALQQRQKSSCVDGPWGPPTPQDADELAAYLPSAPGQSIETSHQRLTHLPASFEVLEAYYQQLETLLLKIGYLYPHTVSSRMQKFRQLFNRALPSSMEVAMLRGVLSQVEWAIQNLHQQISQPPNRDPP